MPNESNFDFPIVELEDDSPQAVGKVGLYDFFMQVGNTGIRFVAAIPGVLQTYGPVFTVAAQKAANLRAASTLAQWGLVSGDTFGFLAQAAGLSPADLATKYNVTLSTVNAWLANQTPVPPLVWRCLAYLVGTLDGRVISDFALAPVSFQPRLIRVFPNVPAPPPPVQPPPPVCPPPPPLC